MRMFAVQGLPTIYGEIECSLKLDNIILSIQINILSCSDPYAALCEIVPKNNVCDFSPCLNDGICTSYVDAVANEKFNCLNYIEFFIKKDSKVNQICVADFVNFNSIIVHVQRISVEADVKKVINILLNLT